MRGGGGVELWRAGGCWHVLPFSPARMQGYGIAGQSWTEPQLPVAKQTRWVVHRSRTYLDASLRKTWSAGSHVGCLRRLVYCGARACM